MTSDAASATAFTPAAAADGPEPFSIDGAEVARRLGVDPSRGLSAAEAAERLRTGGPNKLAEGKKIGGFVALGLTALSFAKADGGYTIIWSVLSLAVIISIWRSLD